MENITFAELNLSPKIKHAIDDMGFETTTSIQEQVIPLIRDGKDVIGRSQTGTGKTIAFAIPAIELIIKNNNMRQTAQVLVLCPTRELSQQACSEIKKITRYLPEIKTAEVYGGAPMMKQITQLKTANIVVGTPGRIMDHMRRRTLKLDYLNMVVLDEADEMLSMGFKEDIETILADAPEDIQTVLFSATMPPAIMALTRKIQNDPILIEINKSQVTLANIRQNYCDVPMGRKTDALALLFKFYNPNRAVVFCNTKKMVDEIVEKLTSYNIDAQGIHGDLKQTQRTQVMDDFKLGKTTILVATDVAARGIDVKDIDYVINYDIPQTNEYYVHRIGRTGRAGKEGCAITICSGRRQISIFRDIVRQTKSTAEPIEIPTAEDIRKVTASSQIETIKKALAIEIKPEYTQMLDSLIGDGNSLHDIAALALQLHFDTKVDEIADIKSVKGKPMQLNNNSAYSKLIFSLGRSSRIAPNHIVGAIAERMDISGQLIGKIDIYDQYTIVEMPNDIASDVVDQMSGSKICGKTVNVELSEDRKAVAAVHPYSKERRSSSFRGGSRGGSVGGSNNTNAHHGFSKKDGNKFNRPRKTTND